MATSTNQNANNEKTNDFSNFKMPNIDTEAFMDSYKKNLEMLGLINKMSIEVCNGIAKIQSAFVQQMISDMGNSMRNSKPSEVFAKFSELNHDNIVKVIGNSKQITDMLTSAHKDVTNAITKRFKESVEEAKNIVNKKR
ncbi:MAG: TIGR01841 family phasin [Holosporaceae bacterium]|jgi:phasin family protein|nr:TIGR01841 family phasin [Holosporaceae bacterium]